MPFALVFVGMILIITGFQNTYQEFGTQVQSDFSGPSSFLYWIIALGIVGAIGYIPAAQTPSRAFMVLIIIAMFVASKNGIFAQAESALSSGAISQGVNAPVDPVGAGVPSSSAGTSGGGSGSSGGGSGILGDVSAAASIASFF